LFKVKLTASGLIFLLLISGNSLLKVNDLTAELAPLTVKLFHLATQVLELTSGIKTGLLYLAQTGAKISCLLCDSSLLFIKDCKMNVRCLLKEQQWFVIFK
jgi:hypothetical protein